MGFVLQASCSKCNYLSDELIIGDGMHFIFICENCNSVVNAQRMPFRYTLSTCPKCKKLLRRSAWVDGLNLVISFDQPIESEYQCPRCNENPLGFKEIAHFGHSMDERIPQVGMLVHGQFKDSGELVIPFLATHYCVVHLEGATDHPPKEIMELRVKRLEPESSTAKNKPPSHMNIFLEFVRYLSQEDLERESMEQPLFKSKTREFLEKAGLFADDKAT
jgi:hypothetical protein